MTKRRQAERDVRVKEKKISWKQTVLTYCTMLLLVGIQVGIIIFPGYQSMSELIQVAIIMIYWAIVAALFTFITNWQIREGYDRPMRRLSEATKKVAEGDFSIYVEPIHTADKHDYIDVMFLDFNKMVAELGSIETLKNDFVSNVSHELKTPLAVIKNYTTLLKKGSLAAETQEEYKDIIIEYTDRLSALITNILKLTKLDSQAIESTVEPYDLCGQLADCFLQFESLWEKKDIEIEVDIEERVVITADENMMEIVWNNLLANAVKFTEPGGKIVLKQTSDVNTITVSVSDSGCGMSAETIKHIFDKFYQGDTSHSKEGNGLGLALAYRIVEKAGGTLSVESQVGKGSIFTVHLNA